MIRRLIISIAHAKIHAAAVICRIPFQHQEI